jgi:uncharacterized protein YqhQ
LPGGLRFVDDGGVEFSVLDRADREQALPRLGGMARPEGVVVVSERYWALAGRDGSLREGEMPQTLQVVRHVPLVRGLARLATSLAPLFRRRGVAAPRERLLLLTAVVAPIGLAFMPPPVGLIGGIAASIALVAWMLRGRTLFLHGAEHRAIAAAEERRLVATWNGEARPSRFSARCGTNFSALVLPVAVAADRLLPFSAAVWSPIAVSLVALALTMELWQLVQGSQRTAARALLLPGLGLQRLTTREPTLDETRIALRAVDAVLRRELSHD